MKLKLFVSLLLTSYAAFSMTRVTPEGIRATVFTSQELADMQSPHEVFAEDLEEKCGNCCWQGVEDGCPLGCSLGSLVAGAASWGFCTTMKSRLVEILQANGISVVQKIVENGEIAAAGLAIGAVSFYAARAGDHAGKQAEIRNEEYQKYLQKIEKLSPEERANHIKECVLERERIKYLLTKKNN